MENSKPRIIPRATRSVEEAPDSTPARPPTGQYDTDLGDWQTAMARAYRDPIALLASLGLRETDLPYRLNKPANSAGAFPLRVPHAFVQRMRANDPFDPLLLQVLPVAAENLDSPGFSHNPVGDDQALVAPGLLHKYANRALLSTTPACAVHCRYCFRQHFAYNEAGHGPQVWDEALGYLKSQPQIKEVILSGGDPLMLSDRRLALLLNELNQLKQLKRLRIHTRVPVVLPARINNELLALIAASRLPVVIVLHINHAQEINEELASACQRLREAMAQAGAGGAHSLLNQSVLLRGINDSADALIGLSERLFDIGVLPYYLHTLDQAQGTAHFDVDARRALQLHAEMTANLPGFLVPRLVREIAGEDSKTWLT